MSNQLNAITVFRRIVIYISLCLVVGSLFYLFGMLIWAYRLDDDSSFRYACCTQDAVAAFHARFWWRFFTAAKLGFGGCVGIAATLASRTVLKIGIRTLGVSVVLLFSNFTLMNLHDWSGSTGFTITQVVFCAGLALLIIGGARVIWLKFHTAAPFASKTP